MTKPPPWAGLRSGGLQPLNKAIARFISSVEFCAFLRMNRDGGTVCSHLYGGVELVLVPGFDPLEPLNDRLDVTADFALERGGSSVVHSGVDRVSASQDGFRVGALCEKEHEKTKTQTEC